MKRVREVASEVSLYHIEHQRDIRLVFPTRKGERTAYDLTTQKQYKKKTWIHMHA